jgi:hypothetical protein
MILPKRGTYVKVKPSLSSLGSIECCVVYELVDQRNEHKPIMGFHQVFIAVKVFAMPLVKRYKASAVIFMARNGQFTGSKEYMKRLKDILRDHLVNNEYSFRCTIRDQTLELKAVFHPGRHAIIDVTLKETDRRTNKGPIPF